MAIAQSREVDSIGTKTRRAETTVQRLVLSDVLRCGSAVRLAPRDSPALDRSVDLDQVRVRTASAQ